MASKRSWPGRWAAGPKARGARAIVGGRREVRRSPSATDAEALTVVCRTCTLHAVGSERSSRG
eukprot:2952283-Pleurochrysis_carterae.AAC.1